jgi:hypothetical protein
MSGTKQNMCHWYTTPVVEGTPMNVLHMLNNTYSGHAPQTSGYGCSYFNFKQYNPKKYESSRSDNNKWHVISDFYCCFETHHPKSCHAQQWVVCLYIKHLIKDFLLCFLQCTAIPLRLATSVVSITWRPEHTLQIILQCCQCLWLHSFKWHEWWITSAKHFGSNRGLITVTFLHLHEEAKVQNPRQHTELYHIRLKPRHLHNTTIDSITTIPIQYALVCC